MGETRYTLQTGKREAKLITKGGDFWGFPKGNITGRELIRGGKGISGGAKGNIFPHKGGG